MSNPQDSSPRSILVPSRLAVATSGPVVRRALIYLGVVGSVLIAINHGDAILQGDIDGLRWLKMLLTPFVPYVVSTLSSVSAIRANLFEQAEAVSSPEPAVG